MSWTKIRVSRYTRNLHPEDHQPGLPQPGPLEDGTNQYEEYHVRQNDAGEWTGRNGTVNQWLVDNTFTNAEPTEIETATVQPKEKPTRKRGTKRKAL